jgi:protein gp37
MMADKTKIEWTDATWNPITGCSVVSPGCTNCYAMRLAGTRLKYHPTREGLTTMSKAGPVWNGEVRFNRNARAQPLDWKRPRMIFVCAHGDLFAENVPDEWILDVFTVMAIASQHTFQVLTKRAERMHEFLNRPDLLDDIYANWYSFSGGAREVWSWPLHNVWLGCSAEDQARYDQRRRWLDDTPAAKRFWSMEPLLGSVEMNIKFVKPDWVIAGGESGPGPWPRPMHPDWARSLRDQCAAAGVPFFFKQWGEWLPEEDLDEATARETYQSDLAAGRTWRFTGVPMRRVGKARAGRLLDGVEHNSMPSIDRRAA